MRPAGPDDEDGLAAALAERALARGTLGCAAVGVALGVLAVVFLSVSGTATTAATAPVVVLLMLGQLAGLAGAAVCAVRLRSLRSGARPQDAAAAAARGLRTLGGAVVAVGAGVVVALPLLLEPRGTALLSAVLGAGVLAQVVVVMTVLRRPLGRAARAPGRLPPRA